MRALIAPPRSTRRAGFSLLETMVACVLSVVLVSILGSMIAAFDARGRGDRRGELVQEADLTMTRLADDLRGLGGLTRPETRTLFYAPEELQIIFSDRTISYTVQDQTLVRSVEPGVEPAAIVAHRVQHLQVLRIDPQGPLFEFSLTYALPFLENRADNLVLERSFHLIAVLP